MDLDDFGIAGALDHDTRTAATHLGSVAGASEITPDVLALHLHGNTADAIRGTDTTYGFNAVDPAFNFANLAPGAIPSFVILDSGGVDTLDTSGFTMNQTINLGSAMYSDIGGGTGNIAIDEDTVIENAIGGSGNDNLLGNDAANTLRGGDGHDLLLGGAGADIIFGGAGIDTVDYYYGFGATFDLSTGTIVDGEGFSDTVKEVEQFYGSGHYADIFTGDDTATTFFGFGGNDYIVAGDAGADIYYGGTGFDTISYFDSLGANVNLGLNIGIASNVELPEGQAPAADAIVDIEQVYGSGTYADVLVGNDDANTFWGFGGDDVLVGMGGADSYYGGEGNDTFGFNLSDFQDGVWDVVADFGETDGNFDSLYFAGVAAEDLVFGETDAGVYISLASLGGNGGVFVMGATQVIISDQLLFA